MSVDVSPVNYSYSDSVQARFSELKIPIFTVIIEGLPLVHIDLYCV